MKFITLATCTLFLMSQVLNYFIIRLTHIHILVAALKQLPMGEEVLMTDVMSDQVIGIVNIL